MGLTHYWKRAEEFPADAFRKAVLDCKLLLAAIDAKLAGPECRGEPIFQPDSIQFNGIHGQHCEPFSMKIIETPKMPGRPVFSYCKTEGLPYDLAVKCTLVVLKHYLHDSIRIMSDAKQDEWQEQKKSMP